METQPQPQPQPQPPLTQLLTTTTITTSSSNMEITNKPKIFIIYTGGTLGMARDERTKALVPVKGYLAQQLSQLPEMKSPEMPSYAIVEFDPLLDSSDMTSDEWADIASLIEENYYDYEGFVILHGTDTMAYAASALSFMLENLGKTVVFTGKKHKTWKIQTDSKTVIAGKMDVPEVCIFFNNVLLRGCRARKLDSWGLSAFESPNCPPLGTLGLEMRFSDEVVGNLLKEPLQGLIIQSYGSGNAPAKKKDFLQLISNAVQRGVVVVVTSQCPHGTVNLKQYATGLSLLQAGAISGHDMTVECAASKLAHLLARGLPTEQVREFMEANLRGELTKLKKKNN